MQVAKGEWILWLDVDEIRPSFLQRRFPDGAWSVCRGDKSFRILLGDWGQSVGAFCEQGLGSFYAFHFLGRCMEHMGKAHESLFYDYTASSIHTSYFAQKREVVL
ncbi:hypothetical protein BP422_21205 [Brevibacillus formosus]|uniref:Uncharacterized protein n=1 Tax=Brevibacillus formosus TaxID=54913 RepID=A0A220ML71_9BACL|nr:hypothetical protein BP422_21205 [Brevibacillus formosus]